MLYTWVKIHIFCSVLFKTDANETVTNKDQLYFDLSIPGLQWWFPSVRVRGSDDPTGQHQPRGVQGS